MQIKQLFIYPVKSLGGISLKQSEVTLRGLKYDRRYMIIDEHNVMLTQRQMPELALFKVSLVEQGFTITYQDKQLLLPFDLNAAFAIKTKVWDDEVEVLVAPTNYNTWFSKCLNKPVRLVYMPDTTLRAVDTKYATQNEMVSLADGYPILLISEASMDLLNKQLEQPVSIDRFRPNVVIDGLIPHQEDELGMLKVVDVVLKIAKPCARCQVITVHQQTAKQGVEPLKTLANYRKFENKILFGANALVYKTGLISIGDELLQTNNSR